MILLTGITGKSGQWLFKTISECNTNLRVQQYKVIIRNPCSNTSLIKESGLDVEIANGDLRDLDFLIKTFKNADIVFHIAGIHTSENVVKAAKVNGVKWIVLVHTTGIFSKYKEAGEQYRNTEKNVRELLLDTNIKLTILRPTMIYGSLNDKNVAIFIKMVDRLKVFPVVDHARYPLQPVHYKDLGDAYFEVLSNREITQGKDYILSGKEPILLIDMFKAIASQLGRQNIYVSVPFSIAYLGSVIVFILSLKRCDIREKVQRLVEPRVFPHDDASKDFGYSPMSFQEGIIDEVKEYIRIQIA